MQLESNSRKHWISISVPFVRRKFRKKKSYNNCNKRHVGRVIIHISIKNWISISMSFVRRKFLKNHICRKIWNSTPAGRLKSLAGISTPPPMVHQRVMFIFTQSELFFFFTNKNCKTFYSNSWQRRLTLLVWDKED